MGKTKNAFGNRILNTAAIPVRAGGTAVTAISDVLNMYYTMGKESYEVIADTTQNVKNTLLGAWNHGKRYHKAANIPLSPVIATGAALEGVVRSVVQPLVNGVVNTRNTGKNTIKNARRSSFGRVFSKKPISDFSYDHMKTRGLKLNNRFSKLQFCRGKSSKVKSNTNNIEKAQREKVEKVVAEKPSAAGDSTTKSAPKESKPAAKQDGKPEKTAEAEGEPAPKKITETVKTNVDIAKALEKDDSAAMAIYLGLMETANMVKHREKVVKLMKEGKEIKEDLIKYEDEARKIIDKHKGDEAIRANIALDLMKLDMTTEGLKVKNDERDKKYVNNLKKYQKDNIKTAKMQARQIKFKEIDKIIERITGTKSSRA